MNLCDIILLTWNQPEVTRRGIESLLAHTHVPCRLLIIDNASKPDMVAYLKTLKGNDTVHLETVFNLENVGFVRGMNQGIEMAEAPFVCLANSDLVFTEGWLAEMLNVMRENPDVGVLNPNSNNLGSSPRKGQDLDAHARELRKTSREVFIELPFCVGFCMMIRREVIQKAGGLSEAYIPMFFEDTDYSLKALKAGFRIGMAKRSYVWHQEHASVDTLGKERQEAIFQQSRKVFEKTWGKILRIAFIVDSRAMLDEHLHQGVALARGGNFVWFLVPRPVEGEEDVFRKKQMVYHGGVKMVPCTGKPGIFWNVLKKKKPYDLLVTDSAFLQAGFRRLGFAVIGTPELDRVTDYKRVKVESL